MTIPVDSRVRVANRIDFDSDYLHGKVGTIIRYAVSTGYAVVEIEGDTWWLHPSCLEAAPLPPLPVKP